LSDFGIKSGQRALNRRGGRKFHEISLTLESLRRSRSARENSGSAREPAIHQELWNGIAEASGLSNQALVLRVRATK
jgi:hypothetical protein